MNNESKSIGEISINNNATEVCLSLKNGKSCKIFDNTQSIDEIELEGLLKQLAHDKHFGINVLSSSDGIIYMDKPKLSHIQICDEMYRLYLYRHHAIIESF